MASKIGDTPPIPGIDEMIAGDATLAMSPSESAVLAKPILVIDTEPITEAMKAISKFATHMSDALSGYAEKLRQNEWVPVCVSCAVLNNLPTGHSADSFYGSLAELPCCMCLLPLKDPVYGWIHPDQALYWPPIHTTEVD